MTRLKFRQEQGNEYKKTGNVTKEVKYSEKEEKPEIKALYHYGKRNRSGKREK